MSTTDEHDFERLKRIQLAVSYGRDKSPDSKVLNDMEWLTYELNKAWSVERERRGE